MEEFNLRLTKSIKRYNVARFDGSEMPVFKNWIAPVMMTREIEQEEEEEDDDEPVAGNPIFRRRIRRRRKKNRTLGWKIQDKDTTHALEGTLEGGMSKAASSFMVFMKTGENEYSMSPVEDWFRFKKPLNYRTLTLDEAEEMNNEKKRNVERWMMKHKVMGSKLEGSVASASDVAPRSGLRTGAEVIQQHPASSTMSSSAMENTDFFQVAEKASRTVRKSTVEGDPAGDDGGDFNETFDDDESDTEMVGGGATAGGAADSDDDDEEETVEGKASSTGNGKSLKDLLQEEKKKSDSSSESDEPEEKKSGEEGDFVIKHDLGGNVIRMRVDEEARKEVKKGEKRPMDHDNSTGATTMKEPDAKQQRTDFKSSVGAHVNVAQATQSTVTGLTERNLQQVLSRYGGRMKTRDLLLKFKKHIKTKEEKALFRDIIRTICNVEQDPIDGRILVLKSAFM